jgi:tyrosine-protein phosphatase SIW14
VKAYPQVAHRFFAVVVVVAALCLPAPPEGVTKPSALPLGRSPAQKLTLTGVKNFGQVTPLLFRGAQPSREGFNALAAMGVDIVVDGRLSGQDSERKVVTALGMRYVSIPWHCLFPKDKTFAKFLVLLRDNPNKKVFVHCRYGDDRTGMMVAAYRMAVENWGAEEAWQEMQQFGYNHTVCFPLHPYEKGFPERLKKNRDLRGIALADH